MDHMPTYTTAPNSASALGWLVPDRDRQANARDWLTTPDPATLSRVIESVVRACVAEHSTDTVPHVLGLVTTLTPDRYGNRWFACIRYSRESYLATYGGRMTSSGYVWQCYLD